MNNNEKSNRCSRYFDTNFIVMSTKTGVALDAVYYLCLLYF